MNTSANTSAHPHRSRRRHRMAAPLLLVGPTVAAAVLLSATSGGQIQLVDAPLSMAPLRPPGDGSDGPTPAPSTGDPNSSKKRQFDEYGYYQCIQNYNNDPQSCCIIHDGKWTPSTNDPHNPTGTCTAARPLGDRLPGGAGLPTEAVDVGSPRTPPGFPTEAVDPGVSLPPTPTTTPPPVVRDHRTS